MQTGAAFVEDGKTGILVNRLPPGASRVESAHDSDALRNFIEAIDQAHGHDRWETRKVAEELFDTHRIVDTILRWFEQLFNKM